MAGVAGAATFNVDRTDDDPAKTACDDLVANDCSLRGAVIAANTASGADTVNIPAGTYLLTMPTACVLTMSQFGTFGETAVSLCLQGSLTLSGAGADDTIIDAGGLGRVALVGNLGAVEIEGVTMRHGQQSGSGSYGGGGAINSGGDLTITDSIVRASIAQNGGGGIYNSNALTLVRSAITANSAGGDGGGIFNSSFFAQVSMSVTASEIRDNVSVNLGGGIFNYQGILTIDGSTLSGNSAGTAGGGLHILSGNFAPTTILTNSTISDNENHWSYGGGLYNDIGYAMGGTTELRNVTVAGNRAGDGSASGIGGGIANGPGAVLRIANTLVANNTASYGGVGLGPDCYDGGTTSTITSLGYNLIETVDVECSLSGNTTGNVTGQDPALGPLGDHGGGIETHALLPGGPAVDAGNPAGCTDVDANPLTSDQRGALRPVDGDGDDDPRCDIGAFELGEPFALTTIVPPAAGDAAPVLAVLHGVGFASDATVVLRRAGEPDIPGEEVTVDTTGAALAATFDVTSKALGAWDVVVSNPGVGAVALAGGFTIEETRAAEPWVDITGPRLIRRGVPSRFRIVYGNRGNTDAVGVPLVLGVPDAVVLGLRAEVLTPTQTVGPPIDWARVSLTVKSDEIPPSPIVPGNPVSPGTRVLPLVLPIVPAGFTGTVEFTLLAPFSIPSGTPLQLVVAVGDPWFRSPLDPAIAKRLVRGIKSYARRVLNLGLSATLDSSIEQALRERFDDLIARGAAAYKASLASMLPVVSVPQTVVAGAAAIYHLGGGESCGNGVDDDGDGLADAADPDCQDDDADGDDDGDGDDEGDDEEPPECEPEEPENPWYADDDCDGEPDCKEGGFNTCAPAPCEKWPPTACGGAPPPPTPVGPYDPNDKIGSHGAGAAGFFSGAEPLRYTVSFENVATATAPALDVVITDPLDASTLDLSTLSLGVITFGETTVVPPPGLSSFTTDIDLRPANDLLVRISAALDLGTSVLTWSLRSLDPATGEPPTEADAGFLPPNVSPPTGEGSVSFTVDPLAGLPTGTEIRNDASIVFDVNPPIVTPEWLNTVDRDAPTSQVTSLAGAACSQTLAVAWSGADTGSGIASYDVLVSEEGGPFAVWLNDTTEPSGVFLGAWGRSYGFASVARDRTGHVETVPLVADVTGAVADCGPFDVAVTKIAAPKSVTLTRRAPAPRKIVKVQIQNRSAQAQTIGDLDTLRALVELQVQPLGPPCAEPGIVLLRGRPQKELPLVLKSKQKLNVAFRVTFGCTSDPLKSTGGDPGHEDYVLSASVDQSVLGGADAFPADDACPREVAPPGVTVPYPDGRIMDKGCGAKKPDKTFGAPVLVDLVDKR